MDGYQIVSEALIFNKDDLLYKFDDWKSDKSKVLLIIGYAGSGKSTLGKELAKKYKAKYYSTDFTDVPGLENYWKHLENKYSIKKAIDIWNKNAHKFFIKHFKSIKEPTIWEGIHLLWTLSPEQFSQYPTIIKGTSHIVSTTRAIRRNLKRNEGNEKNLPWYNLILWTILDNINITKYLTKLKKYLKRKGG